MNRFPNRIVGDDLRDPQSLTPHPLNPKIHPPAQQSALAGVLDLLGWWGRIIINQQTGYILNGHARVQAAIAEGQAQVPVTLVDLAPDDERLLLVFLDRIAQLAGTDRLKLDALLTALPDQPAPVQQVLDDLRTEERLDAILHDDDDLVVQDVSGRNPLRDQQAVVKVGPYRQVIPRTQYAAWLTQLAADGYDVDDIPRIRTLILERLNLVHEDDHEPDDVDPDGDACALDV